RDFKSVETLLEAHLTEVVGSLLSNMDEGPALDTKIVLLKDQNPAMLESVLETLSDPDHALSFAAARTSDQEAARTMADGIVSLAQHFKNTLSFEVD
ncbi:hypothetical protein HZC07_00305, partial [Candidatus Micrarchaeota archaeon]|nr:hypothetical protein [Candidatus Micrarchaeota archaeon]